MQRNGSRSSLSSSLGIVGTVAGAIGAVSTILGFINSHGGIFAVLAEIGRWGFACYCGLVPGGLLAAGILTVLEGSITREAHDRAALPIIIAGLLAGAAFIRYVLADPEAAIRKGPDGDPLFVIIGFAVIAFPLGYLWWKNAKKT